MKKIFKLYLVIWAALLAAFNIVSFVSVGWAGHEKYTPSFWFGYVLITIAFLGQLGCAYFALRDGQLKKTFYRISLLAASYAGLILSFVFGGLCMLVPVLPYWLGILLCGVVLAFNVIAVVKAAAAIEAVSGIDDKLNNVYTRSGQNSTPNSNATNLHSSQKRCCSFCISSSNASPTFQVQKSIFHQMTKPIQVTVILPLLLAISFSRNDDIHSSISGISNDLIGVIPTIGQ